MDIQDQTLYQTMSSGGTYTFSLNYQPVSTTDTNTEVNIQAATGTGVQTTTRHGVWTLATDTTSWGKAARENQLNYLTPNGCSNPIAAVNVETGAVTSDWIGLKYLSSNTGYQYYISGHDHTYLPRSHTTYISNDWPAISKEEQAKLDNAQKKSMDLLKQWLSEAEWNYLMEKGELEIPSKICDDEIYIVKKAAYEKVLKKKSGKPVSKHCLITQGHYPDGDVLLTKIMLIKTDEEQFLKTAVKTAI